MLTLNTEIVSGRVFPQTGTYLGTLIEVPEPELYTRKPDEPIDFELAVQLGANWYEWNQAQMAARAVRYTVITSDSTAMVEYRRMDNRRLIDVYADRILGIAQHTPVMAQHIAKDMEKKLDSLSIRPEMRPIWLPLGHQALNKVKVDYTIRHRDEENEGSEADEETVAS